MKQLLIIILILTAMSLVAQQENVSFKTKQGIGITFGQDVTTDYGYPQHVYPMNFSNIYFPIEVSEKFRIEPEFGYYRSQYGSGSGSVSYNLRIGFGFFSVKALNQFKILTGGRLGLITNSGSTNDYYLGLATGGEYYFHKQFSLGGEVQLNYIIIDSPYSNSSTNLISTRGLVILRFYY